MSSDKSSISGQNLNFIANNSGYSFESLLNTCPKIISNAMTYAPIPKDDIWKVSFLQELLNIRSGALNVDGIDLKREEIQDMINMVTTN